MAPEFKNSKYFPLAGDRRAPSGPPASLSSSLGSSHHCRPLARLHHTPSVPTDEIYSPIDPTSAGCAACFSCRFPPPLGSLRLPANPCHGLQAPPSQPILLRLPFCASLPRREPSQDGQCMVRLGESRQYRSHHSLRACCQVVSGEYVVVLAFIYCERLSMEGFGVVGSRQCIV